MVEESAAPHYVLTDAGAVINIASPLGGQSPVHPKSETPEAHTPATAWFYKDVDVITTMANSLKRNDVNQADYDSVFDPGGHGTLWDLANDERSIQLIEDFFNAKKPIAFVCHAPAALIKAKEQNGHLIVDGTLQKSKKHHLKNYQF